MATKRIQGYSVSEAVTIGAREALEDAHVIAPLPVWGELTARQREAMGARVLRQLQQLRLRQLPADDYSGTTACGYVLYRSKVYPMAIGDSALFSVVIDDEHQLVSFERVTPLHIPTRPHEMKRISKIKDAEIIGGRVDGVLAVTRHIGSIEMKCPGEREGYVLPGVSFDPEAVSPITLPRLKPNQRHFLILACDGLTEAEDAADDAKGSERLYRALQSWLSDTVDAKALMQKGLDAGSGDNISVVVLETSNRDIHRAKSKAPALLVALFDGHNGEQSALWCRDAIVPTLTHMAVQAKKANRAAKPRTLKVTSSAKRHTRDTARHTKAH